uniref:DNA/RNA-binding protein Alba n=1 Tax=uncultured marine thaumarchaeote AD1000_11_E10 TaxID=1455890 RepID=A0A075FJH1_9ARCH|nr:chromatin protein (ssh10b) [uncultured marine thaumarchaeote AD1000_11_E10]
MNIMSEEFNSTNNDETQSPVEQAAQPTETTVNESVETPATNEVVDTPSQEPATNEVVDTPSQEPARDPNTIYVGKKRVMNYVLACMTILQNGSDTVTIKARGRSISAAVDVAQILTRRFTQGINVKSISIATEQVPNRESNEMSNVSSIEIEMGK